MCSTAIAPAWCDPSSHREGCWRGWQVSNPHPTGVCLPASLSLSQICLVWAEGEVGRRSRAAGSEESESTEGKGDDRVVERILGRKGDDVAHLPGALEVA